MAKLGNAGQGNYVTRDTIVVTRGEIGNDYTHPEKIRLQLDKRVRVHPIDIGSLAYTVRQPMRKAHLLFDPLEVDESSFNARRRELIVAIHDYIATTGHQDTTVDVYVNDYLKVIHWFDTNGYSDAFEVESSSREAYQGYVRELNHLVNISKLSPRTANSCQRKLISLFNLYWGEEVTSEIIREIPIIKFKRRNVEAPEEYNVLFATKTFLYLARGFKKFSLENKPFPYLLRMPDYDSYIFPTNNWACVTPYAANELAAYHYQEGRLSTPKEYTLKVKRHLSLYEANREIRKSKKNLISINSDIRNPNRLNYASLAMQSYMQLFILMTGVNPSELVQLEYDESFTLEKDLLKNDFRAIKLRAKGREVSYHLGNRQGLVVFKEYIQLRNWVLDGNSFPFLFFSMHRIGTYTGNYSQISRNYVYQVYKNVIGKFFPLGFSPITSSKVRKYKTVVWNEIGISQEVIAGSLNHTIETNQKYYAISSPDKQQKEFELFFESARAAAKAILQRSNSKRTLVTLKDTGTEGVSTPSGHCDDFKNPEPAKIEPPIEPNCTTQMGCLYCKHYVCHADEEDIKKLYSLLYVIEAVRRMATDFNHSDKLLLELSIRIQQVLQQMSEKSEEVSLLVESIKEEVIDYGILTPFWEFRLQRYEQMGVVI